MAGDERCLSCNGWPRENRLTLPRAKTGDLVFCGYQCMKRWEAKKKETAV